MDDVVYHLDSQKDFYAELDDQLSQPEPVTDPYVVNNIVNAFVGFLVAFQGTLRFSRKPFFEIAVLPPESVLYSPSTFSSRYSLVSCR